MTLWNIVLFSLLAVAIVLQACSLVLKKRNAGLEREVIERSKAMIEKLKKVEKLLEDKNGGKQ